MQKLFNEASSISFKKLITIQMSISKIMIKLEMNLLFVY